MKTTSSAFAILTLLGLTLTFAHMTSAMPGGKDMEEMEEMELMEEEFVGSGKPRAKVIIVVDSLDEVDPSMMGEREYEILTNMVAEDEE